MIRRCICCISLHLHELRSGVTPSVLLRPALCNEMFVLHQSIRDATWAYALQLFEWAYFDEPTFTAAPLPPGPERRGAAAVGDGDGNGGENDAYVPQLNPAY